MRAAGDLTARYPHSNRLLRKLASRCLQPHPLVLRELMVGGQSATFSLGGPRGAHSVWEKRNAKSCG